MKMTTVDFDGTVCSGTNLPYDLVPGFMNVLAKFYPEAYDDTLGNLNELAIGMGFDSYDAVLDMTQKVSLDDLPYEYWYSDGVIHILYESIWNFMNQIALSGYYFGSSEGDSFNYGYWKFNDEDDWDSNENDTEEVDDEY
jgi:hypothetical protein